ncbi:FUSC family protein [Mycolicibacterium baixiangningiae]|uniref:FUSC family protein n=1 Tax=Mycolicibacterium baixiangningiae TaxID=2761578 RepID=UPI001867A038|nr:FUSC family protein [Mycolicibacterium baixiangningiae]
MRPRAALPALLQPVGRSRWGMAAALACALGLLLIVPQLQGRPAFGSALALGFVLTAVPSLPTTWPAALTTIAARAAAVLVAGALVVACGGHPAALAVATVVAAVSGALIDRVGATAGLAVVLIAVDAGPHPSLADLSAYAIGAGAVSAAWAVWWFSANTTAALRNRPHDAEEPAARSLDRAHAARVATVVAVAVVVAGWLPDDAVGGHWLVTSVLLTIQPGRSATRTRLVQRLCGNTAGATLAAALLGAHPAAPVAVAVTVLLFLLAVALRPVNYTWWAITGPPVLLVVSEYPHWFPWYEGGVRLGMNLAGAAIVVAVVFIVPKAWAAFPRPAPIR